MRRDPFRGHLFPKDVILQAVRWYCRYPLSNRDVRDMLAERRGHRCCGHGLSLSIKIRPPRYARGPTGGTEVGGV